MAKNRTETETVETTTETKTNGLPEFSVVNTKLYPIRCQGITLEHLSGDQDRFDKLASNPKLLVIEDNYKGVLAAFHTDHKKIRMVQKGEKTLADKDTGLGPKRCEACQSWYGTAKAKAANKDNGFAHLKRMINAQEQAGATLREYGDELDDSDRRDLEAIVADTKPRIAQSLKDNPTYKERLSKAGIAIPAIS